MKTLVIVTLVLTICMLLTGGVVGQSFQSYGSASSVNSVILDGSGTPTAGGAVALTSFNVLPFAQGFFMASPSQSNVPVLGGTVYLDPGSLSITSIVAAGTGTHTAAGALPNDPGLVGLVIHMQTAFLDPSQPNGVAFSNGLTMTVGAAP